MYLTTYVVETAGGSDNHRIRLSGGTDTVGSSNVGVGVFTEVLVAQAGNSNIDVQALGAGFTGTISKITVREVTNAAIYNNAPEANRWQAVQVADDWVGVDELWTFGVVVADGTAPQFSTLAGVGSGAVSEDTQYAYTVTATDTNGSRLRFRVGAASVDITTNGKHTGAVNSGAHTRLSVVQQDIGATGTLIISVKRILQSP